MDGFGQAEKNKNMLFAINVSSTASQANKNLVPHRSLIFLSLSPAHYLLFSHLFPTD